MNVISPTLPHLTPRHVRCVRGWSRFVCADDPDLCAQMILAVCAGDADRCAQMILCPASDALLTCWYHQVQPGQAPLVDMAAWGMESAQHEQ